MQSKRLILVENDVILVKIWAKFFARRGVEVIKAYHAPEAIEAIIETPVDFAFVDLRLNGPTPSGLEVVDFIRNAQSRIPIVFITGLEEDTELYQEAVQRIKQDEQSGIFTKMLRKPISIKVLAGTLEEMKAYVKTEETEAISQES